MEKTALTWLLGANSARGFHSLYEGFPPEGAFLRVIKGGPGTGKSSFMRRIAAAAEAAGLGVEYIICSGDPDSLDAVYIPELKTAYADGTSPHVLEPAVFGADGDYLELGRYCSRAAARAASGELRRLSAEYKAQYARAYSLLAAAAEVSPAASGCYAPEEARAAVRSRAANLAARELGGLRAAPGAVHRRFLGGLTCRGRILLGDTLASLCERLYLLDNRLGLGFEFAGELARQAVRRRCEAVICPFWLRPELTEAVIFPELRLGFAVIDPLAEYPERHRCLHLDRMAGAEALRDVRAALREDEKLSERLIFRAGQHLAAAKALHDGLEAVLRPALDTGALSRAAAEEISRLGL